MIGQIVVGLSGIGGIALLGAESNGLRRWGGLVGLVGQPFWLYAAGQSGQWGQFAVSVVATALYLKSAWQGLRHFSRKSGSMGGAR